MSDKKFTKSVTIEYEVRPITFYEIHRKRSDTTDGPLGSNRLGGGYSAGVGWSNGEYGLFKTEAQAERVIAFMLANEK